MKKIIGFFLWAVLALSIYWVSLSDSVLDYLDNIGDGILFGYTPSEKISVDSITSTSIDIKSPVLKDEFDDTINDYTLLYSKYPLEEILDDLDLLDESNEKVFSDLNLSNKTDFVMTLDDWDLDDDMLYYLVSMPSDSAGSHWEISNEICFRLSDWVFGDSDDCQNWVFSTNDVHGAGADMNLSNISHTLNWNIVTLRWIAVDWSDELDIFLRDPNNSTFSKLATVDMDDESYSFSSNRNWEHIVKFIPNNWGTDKNYTFNVSGIGDWWNNSDPDPEVTPVVVWPRENIIVIIIGTIIIYLIYRLVKSKN